MQYTCLSCDLRLKLVATIGTECGAREPLRKLAVLQPLYRSTIKSLMSREDPDLVIGRSSMANAQEKRF